MRKRNRKIGINRGGMNKKMKKKKNRKRYNEVSIIFG